MDMSTLPPLGRNGIVNSVRKITDMPTTGFRDIDPSATFVAGQLAKLATLNGKTVVQAVNGTSDVPVGVFFTHNTTTFYRPSMDEAHTFGENTDAPNDIYINPYVKTGYVEVNNASGTAYTVTTDYTINLTNGVITRTSTGAIGATDTVYVNYQYKDVNLSGINQPLGSGKACLLEEVGEIGTLIYDVKAAWLLGAAVKFNADGIFTLGGASATVGTVTQVPTATDPELRIKLSLA